MLYFYAFMYAASCVVAAGGLGALGFLAGEYSHAANYSNFNLAT